jgi:hypothetical protein
MIIVRVLGMAAHSKTASGDILRGALDSVCEASGWAFG